MSRIYRAICILLASAQLGCTSMHSFQHNSVEWAEELKPGETIRVYYYSGRVQELIYGKIVDGQLRGSTLDGKFSHVSIAVADLERVEAERIDPGPTAAAVAGTIILLPLFLIAGFLGAVEVLEAY